jgi:hypothetical protein
MADIDSSLRDIAEIRSIMERSTKFLSLSGFAGIGAGIVGLAGAASAQMILSADDLTLGARVVDIPPAVRFRLDCVGLGTLVLGLLIAWFFSRTTLRKLGGTSHGPAARYLILALAVPLIVGGCMTVMLLNHGLLWLACPALLLFYGLGLFSAGTFTFGEVRTVGMIQILLGLLALVAPAWGLILWAAGFGLVHIAYGILFFRKYRQ